MVSIQAFGVDHILFRISMFSHAGAILNHSPLAVQLFRSAQVFLKIRVFIPNPFKLFRGSYLILAI